MKKICYFLLLLLYFSCAILTSCDTCKHDYETVEYVEATCINDGYKIEICAICRKEKKTEYNSSHNYIYNHCLDYETCSYCKIKNDVFVYHSTNNGICTKCGEYFVSKDNQLTMEYNRHTQALQTLKSSYDMHLQSLESKIRSSTASCIYSRSECISKISSLNAQISQKQFELNKLNSSSSIGGSSSSITQTNKMNLQLQIQNLQSEKSRYQEVLNKWNYIDSLENQKYTLSNKYYSDVEKENSLHRSTLAKINALKY